MANHKGMEKATFAAGCFWGVEAGFRKIPGVISTTVGYTGGTHDNPSYEDVCSGRTGHAEVVQATFDPAQISYGDLLDVFWECHDPTTPNRQGPDVGTQYRSVIFYLDDNQKTIATESKNGADESGYWPDPIVTEVIEINNYSNAEDYHHNYYNDNPNQPYCIFVIKPKLDKLEKQGIIE